MIISVFDVILLHENPDYSNPQLYRGGINSGLCSATSPWICFSLPGNSSFKSYMFSGDESFVPDGLVEVLKKKMNKEDAMPLAVINKP